MLGGEAPSKGLIDAVLASGSSYTSREHTEIDDILRLSRYGTRLEKRMEQQFSVSNLQDMLMAISDHASPNAPVSALLTKPPESISYHLCPDGKGDCFPVIFDSHARPQSGVPGAHLRVFPSGFRGIQQALDHLTELWPKQTGLGGGILEEQYNTVGCSVVKLKTAQPPKEKSKDSKSPSAEPAS